MAKKITIKEIAEKALVSPGTVDRVLHNRGEVSPQTRDKVLKIVRDGNYEPNIFARNLVLNRTYAIASLLPKYSLGDYWASPATGILQAANELKAMGIQNRFYLFEEEDPVAFERMFKKALKDKPDGILLAPVIYRKALRLSELCAAKKLPLIVVDSDIPDGQKLSFIGQNAFKSGYLAAKLLNFGGETHKIYLITITKSTDNNDILKQREEGFNDYFKMLAPPVPVNTVNLHLEDEGFNDQLDNFVKTVGPHDKLFVPNSKAHMIAKAIKGHNKPAGARLVGYDLLKSNLEYLEDGTIDFLINQKPEIQGYQGIQLLYKYLVLKQEVQSHIFMPLEIVTKENMAYVNF